MIEATILFLSSDKQEETNYIHNLLEGEGYLIKQYVDKNSFLIGLEQPDIDLIIIDLDNQDVDAIELCKTIRDSFMLRHIPIILIVKKEHTIEKIKGIYAGADDYLEKPIHAAEFLTRIKASIWRASRDLDANPLTKLPGNASITKELENRINKNQFFCVAYVDLDKFKEYNDYYGFERGDKLIQHTAAILYNALRELGTGHDFLGHIGGDDFLFITSPDAIDGVCKKIIYDFDSSISSFYDPEDIEVGYITVKNRKGELRKLPLMTISIGVTSNTRRIFTHTGQLIQVVTELKQLAKTHEKSIYIIDRRESPKK